MGYKKKTAKKNVDTVWTRLKSLHSGGTYIYADVFG